MELGRCSADTRRLRFQTAAGSKTDGVRTTGEQADVEQRLVAELRRVVTEHGFRASNSHPFLSEPADQPKQFTVTLKGVTAQVAGEEMDKKHCERWRSQRRYGRLSLNKTVKKKSVAVCTFSAECTLND